MYDFNEMAHLISVSQPKGTEARTRAIHRLLQAGCELVVDLDHLPCWAATIPAEAQASVLKKMPELFQYYKLSIPRAANLSAADWEMLPAVVELRHLSVSCETLCKRDLRKALSLKQLEVLVLHTPVVDDLFCESFPRMDQLQMIDVLGTQISPIGILSLQDTCPNARVYADVIT